jgi:hypothetical protein
MFVGCADLSPDTFMEVHGQFIKTETVIQDLYNSLDSTAFPLDEKDIYRFATNRYLPALLFRVAGYEMGLDKTPSIQQQIQAHIPNLMLGQSGLLFKILIPENISTSEEELAITHRLSQLKLQLSYIKVHSLLLADSLYRSITNKTKFEKIAASYYYFNQPKQIFTINDIHPEIFIAAADLTPGNVAAPIQLHDGFYIIKLLGKERSPIEITKMADPEIIELNKRIKQTQFIESYQIDLLAPLEALYDTTAIADFYRSWRQHLKNKKATTFASKDLILLTLDTLEIHAKDVVNYYHSLPVEKRYPVSSPADIHQLINEICLPHLLLGDAFQRGLVYHKYYTEAIKAFCDSLVETLYFQKFVEPQIVVKAEQVMEFYNQNAKFYPNIPKEQALVEIRRKLTNEAMQKAIKNEVNKLNKYYIVRQNILAIKKVLAVVNRYPSDIVSIR